jgi:hypothetical protein
MDGNKHSDIWCRLVSRQVALTFVSGVRHDLKSPLVREEWGCFPQGFAGQLWDRKGDSSLISLSRDESSYFK